MKQWLLRGVYALLSFHLSGPAQADDCSDMFNYDESAPITAQEITRLRDESSYPHQRLFFGTLPTFSELRDRSDLLSTKVGRAFSLGHITESEQTSLNNMIAFLRLQMAAAINAVKAGQTQTDYSTQRLLQSRLPDPELPMEIDEVAPLQRIGSKVIPTTKENWLWIFNHTNDIVRTFEEASDPDRMNAVGRPEFREALRYFIIHERIAPLLADMRTIGETDNMLRMYNPKEPVVKNIFNKVRSFFFGTTGQVDPSIINIHELHKLVKKVAPYDEDIQLAIMLYCRESLFLWAIRERILSGSQAKLADSQINIWPERMIKFITTHYQQSLAYILVHFGDQYAKLRNDEQNQELFFLLHFSINPNRIYDMMNLNAGAALKTMSDSNFLQPRDFDILLDRIDEIHDHSRAVYPKADRVMERIRGKSLLHSNPFWSDLARNRVDGAFLEVLSVLKKYPALYHFALSHCFLELLYQTQDNGARADEHMKRQYYRLANIISRTWIREMNGQPTDLADLESGELPPIKGLFPRLLNGIREARLKVKRTRHALR